ncbi:sulfatase [Ilyomonas limi]|uniref:Sulfatase n=1 Tax=Ilyomonas limi TaxID=2575867 RepID=A0A4U3KU91_9BACT|nr:sulfatase [Ilyomonas limi]TKK65981.1 sulfatase [Ilyomonas limi]
MKFHFLVMFVCTTLFVAAQQKPNIVIIISDDHAYQAISAYGSKLTKTPNIDRIAHEGVLFKKAYVTNSICGPSRAVLLTGKYSNKNGFKDNENSSFDGSQNTFIKELRKSGYLTAWIGKWHLETQPQGFDYWQILPGQGQYYNPDFLTMDGGQKKTAGYVTNVIEDVAEDWLNQRDTAKPFCLVIGHKATHRVWLPDTSDMGMFDSINFPLPGNFYDNYAGREAAKVQDMTIANTMIMGYDLKMFSTEKEENGDGNIKRMNPAQRAKFDAYYQPIYQDFKARHLTGNALSEWKYQRYMRDYLSTAASLDRNIGRTLDYLDKHNLTNNTIVIYISDQGFYLGEHGWFDKRWMYEESFRTPLMMRYPGVVQSGMVNSEFVMNVDVAPTLLDAAGVAIPKDMQGESFLPLLTDVNAKGREAMYYHYYENGEHKVSPHFGIKTKQYKLIRFYKRVNSWELYDLKKDPNEMHNIFNQKKYEKIESDLHHQLLQLINKYDDDDARQVLKIKLAMEPQSF